MNIALKDKISQILSKLGVVEGDTVFIHSGIGAIAGLLDADEPVAIPKTLEAFHAALLEAVGKGGTIAAPGFFYDYARKGKPYVVETSPPDRGLGFYPMHLFKQDGVKRSLNPIANVLAVGRHADEICAHTSAHAYGITSPWARLVDCDAKGLVIGLPFMMTFIHHIEAVVGVPHIYNKIFRTPVIANGKETDLPVIASVRYLDYDIHYKNGPVDELRQASVMAELCENDMNCQLVSFRDAQRVIGEGLAQDSNLTLLRPPKFLPGEVPDDGPRG